MSDWWNPFSWFDDDVAPPTPDPGATAAAQSAANKESAIAQTHLNMVNQYTPRGNLEYDFRGYASDGTPQYKVTQTLSPAEQAKLDLTDQAAFKYGDIANTQLGAVQGKLSTPVSYAGLGAPPTANEATRIATRDAMMGRMEPELDRQRAALETRLANQGIGLGSEAYNTAIDESNRSLADMLLAVDAQAGNEMARMYGLEAARRDRAISEMLQERQVPLNEMAAMMSGVPVQSPSFVSVPQAQIAAPDFMGATYASYTGQHDAFQRQADRDAELRNAMIGGLFGMGSAGLGGLGMSDRRLKTNIRKLGYMANGIGVYVYNYIWGGPEWIGVMADEVKTVLPDAVVRIGEYDAVDYSKILEVS
jgi:hypothetical protein